ncbi:SAV0927 family protein [Anaerobacillus sp. MEB173]|uniref:SAV0927 family protein n=1 Tax=Anaerobacillus sp. MEB173 TaxID=3383345 RepID=UPI003F8E246F
MFENLYVEDEYVNVKHFGFSTTETRYDFSIVYSNLFFGKPLVTCIQTGCSALLDPLDLSDLEYIHKKFNTRDLREAEQLSALFSESITNLPFNEQY